MSNRFSQIDWDAPLEEDCRRIVRLAVREDLDRGFDWTTVSLVPEAAQGSATVVVRQAGVIAGLPAARIVLEEMESRVIWSALVEDGTPVDARTSVAEISGPARDLLTAERLMLNLIGRLSGIATLTRAHVDAVTGTRAEIYDTRKTTPGWRRLEKYAVRRGGGTNHRTGLFDAILIKDNHLAFGGTAGESARFTAAGAVEAVRRFLAGLPDNDPRAEMVVEVEVDSLAQLEEVLPAAPDIVLLDNMRPDQLRQAVAKRDALNKSVQLEASGAVNLRTIPSVAESGVDRISVGALTHSATSLDVGLDWSV